MTQADCRKALKKIAQGNRAGLADLYHSLGREIYAVAFSVTGKEELAEDAMQDTFLKVYEKIGTFRPDGNARAWVLTIARNTAIDLARTSHATYDSLDDLSEVLPAPDCEDPAKYLETKELLSELDADDRELLLLRYGAGFSCKEVSSVTGLSLSCVQKRCQRALQKLKDSRKTKRKGVHRT